MHVALPINTSTRAKRVAQKIKADSRVLLRTTPVLAVHDTRLVGVNLQSALLKPFGDPFHDVFRLVTAAAMQQAVVGVTTERNMWHLASDPGIECVVQKQVGQHRTHRSSNDIANMGGFLDRLIPRESLRPGYGEGWNKS